MRRIPRGDLTKAIRAAQRPQTKRLLEMAQEYIEGKWGRLNPYWYERTFVEIARDKPVKCVIKYSSDQGTGLVAFIVQEPHWIKQSND